MADSDRRASAKAPGFELGDRRFDDLARFCAWWIGPDVVLSRYHLSRPLKEPSSWTAKEAAPPPPPPPGDASHAGAAEPVFVITPPPCLCDPGPPADYAAPREARGAWETGFHVGAIDGLKIGGIPQPPLEAKGAFRGSSVDDVRAAAECLLRMLPHIEEPDEAVRARHSLHAFLDGNCLSCQAFLEVAELCPASGDGPLRAKCAEFDRAGVPLPKALREWSAASRFKAPPHRTGKRGRPPRTYRNGFAVNAMALLAFLTGMRVGRHPDERFDPKDPDAGEGEPSIGSIMATTWAAREAGLTEAVLAGLWSTTKDAAGDRVGPYLLESWRSGRPAPRLSYPDSPVLEGGLRSP